MDTFTHRNYDRTVYRVSIFGRRKFAVGVMHDFDINVILNGSNHSNEEIRIAAYDQCSNIHGFKILSSKFEPATIIKGE